jgi:hypothetical protein
MPGPSSLAHQPMSPAMGYAGASLKIADGGHGFDPAGSRGAEPHGLRNL